MKKVKITLKSGSTGKKFYLFPTSEALYVWLCALERNEQVNVPDIETLVLEPGGFIEAELRGYEYSYEGGQKFRRLELVRLAMAQEPKNSSGLLVTIHSGWVSGGILPMKNYSDNNIEAKVIAFDESKLDMPALFGDDDVYEEGVDVDVDEQDDDDE